MRNTFVDNQRRLGVMLCALALLGVGCKGEQSTTVQPTAPEAIPDAQVAINPSVPDAGVACAPEGFQCYRDSKVGYRFGYPVGWSVLTYEDAPLTVGLIAPTNPVASDHEPIPEITVRIRPNPGNFGPMSFYSEAGETLLQDATAVSPVYISGRAGLFLDDVAGGITADWTIIPFPDNLVEFELTREEYRAEYDTLVASFYIGGGTQ